MRTRSSGSNPEIYRIRTTGWYCRYLPLDVSPKKQALATEKARRRNGFVRSHGPNFILNGSDHGNRVRGDELTKRSPLSADP